MLMITHDLGIVAEICDKVVDHLRRPRRGASARWRICSTDTRHPYTEGLFNSLPNLEHREAAAEAHQGPDAGPCQPAEGLRVLPALRVRHGDLQDAEAAERVYRNEEPLCGVPPV